MEVIKTKEQARQKAIDWQDWQSTRSLSLCECVEWQTYFKELGRKFKLTKEFEENGIV